MSRCTLLLMICFAVSFCPDLYGQHILRGTVTDSLSKPIPYVQVLLYDSTQTGIYGFTQADTLGRYELSVEKPGTYFLTFNILSHKSKTVLVDLEPSPPTSLQRVDVMLVEEPYVLDEIVVETERSISVRGDTIAMKVDDFRRGDEEVVEEVLTKLPGFEVDDNGTIRFAGKQISKVMVEGTDLFGKGYSLLTKNMDANTIDEVEVLQNYLDEAELKGLAKSDDVAINLNLKEDVKISLFGNASLAYNTLNNHEARLVLTSISSKIKQYLFFNSNSIGKDALGDLNQFSSSGRSVQISNSLAEINIKPWKNYESYSLPLDAQRMRFNNSGLASYNFFYSPGDNFEIKAVNIGAFDKDRFNKEVQSIFYTDDQVIRDLESNRIRDRISNGFGKLSSYFKPNMNSKLAYEGNVHYGNTDALANALTVDGDLFQDYRHENWQTDHILRYTNRFTQDNALILNSQYGYQKMDQRFYLNPLFAGELFPTAGNRLVADQDGSIEFNSVQLNGLWLQRFTNAFSVEITAGSSVTKVKDYSTLELEDWEVSSTNRITNGFTNRLDYRIQKTGVTWRFALDNFNFYPGMEITYLDYSYKNSQEEQSKSDNFFIKPEIGFDWRFSKNKFQISYLYDVSLASMSQVNDGYRIYDNRTVERGLGQIHTYRGHNAIARYTYGGWLQRKMLHVTFFYNRNEGTVADNSVVTDDYSLIRSILETNRDVYLLNATADILLPSLQNNLKLSGNYTFSSEGKYINENYYRLKSGVIGYGFDLRSAFDGIFNYTVGSSWLAQDLNTESGSIRNRFFQYADLYFQFTNRLKLQLVTEREVVKHERSKNTVYLLDAFLNMQIKPNKLSCSLELRNILDHHYYVSNLLDGINFSSTRYKLIPRNFLFSLKYRL